MQRRDLKQLAPYLYRQEKQDEAVYGDIPSGQLNVNRLLAGLPYWLQMKEGVEVKKKTILLTDWTMSKVHGWYYQFERIKVLRELLDNEFEILYKNSNGKFEKLTKQNFNENEVRSYFPDHPKSEQTLEESCIKQTGKSKDEILPLNDLYIQLLNSDKPNDLRERYKVEQGIVWGPLAEGETIKERLDPLFKHGEICPGPVFVLSDANVVKSKQELDNLIKAYEPAMLVYEPKKVSVDLSEIDLSNLEKVNIPTLIDTDTPVNQDKLLELELFLDKPNKEHRASLVMGLLVEQMKNLNTLKLSARNEAIVRDKVGWSFLEEFPSVESLVIGENVTIDAKLLVDLIKNCKNLKCLKLVDCKIVGEIPDNLDLTNLETILYADDSKDCKEATTNLSRLISKNAQIKNLFIRTPNANLDIADVNKLLEKTPELMKLCISCDNVTGSVSTKLAKLPKLQTLELDGKGLVNNSNAMSALFGYGENVNHFKVQFHPEKEGVKAPSKSDSGSPLGRDNKINLPNLRRLTVNKCENPEILNMVLKGGQQLEEVEILDSICKFERFEHVFPKLKKLYLSNARDVDLDSFSAWLNMTPNLENLYVHAKEYFDDDSKGFEKIIPALQKATNLHVPLFVLSDDYSKVGDFTRLETLDLSYAKISFEGLKALLNTMPNLKNISLNGTNLFEFDKVQNKYVYRDYISDTNIGKSEISKKILDYIKEKGLNLIGLTPVAVNPFQDIPPFDPKKNENRVKPPTAIFSGDSSKSQGMVMDRVGRYISHHEPNYNHVLEELSDGMCHALSSIFVQINTSDWNAMIENMRHWDGSWDPGPSEEVLKHVKLIFDRYKAIYVKPEGDSFFLQPYHFIGDAFKSFLLSDQSKERGFIISNSWHSISLKYHPENKEWHLYDPNYTNGFKVFRDDQIDEIIKGIEHSLGKAYAIQKTSVDVSPILNDCESFFVHGGLCTICDRALNPSLGNRLYNANLDMVLDLAFKKGFENFSFEKLKTSVFIRSLSESPAFVYAIDSKNPQLQTLSFFMLATLEKKYFAKYKNYDLFISDLTSSMSQMPGYNVVEFLDELKRVNKSHFAGQHANLVNCIALAIPRQQHQSKPARKIEFQEVKSPPPDIKPSDVESQPGLESQASSSIKADKSQPVMVDNDTQEMTNMLQTWLKEGEEENPDLFTYLNHLSSIPAFSKNAVSDHSRLIECWSASQLAGLGFTLQNHCKKNNRPIFYAHSAADLICSAPYIEKVGSNGVIKRGPGGRLYNFLATHNDPANPPIILLNHLDPDDVIRFNGLNDVKRQADGTALPNSAIVIRMMDTANPTCYKGGDLYSRCTSVNSCPITRDALYSQLPSLLIPTVENASDSYPINLFNAEDWRERLIGQWEMRGEQLYFKEGQLMEAIKSGKPIEIQNGLWGNAEFNYFFKEALIMKRLTYPGGEQLLPDNIQFLKSTGYSPELIFDKEKIDKSGFYGSSDADILNPSLFARFFVNYRVDPVNHTLHTEPGIVENHKGKTLHVNLTRDIGVDRWSNLLNECKKHHVSLVCHGVMQEEKTVYDIKSNQNTQVIQSNDVSARVKQLAMTADWQIIDVTGCEPNDLLMNLQGQFDKEHSRYAFSETKSALLTALEENKNIILKGNFSSKLADALAPILLKRYERGDQNDSKLIVVCNDASRLDSFPVSLDIVSEETKQNLLLKKFKNDEINAVSKHLSAESLDQITARLTYRRRMGARKEEINDDLAWQGIESLPGGVVLDDFDSYDYKDKAEAFSRHRLDAVNDVLKHSPYVFLTGLTGVGKSTFVETYLKTEGDRTLYKGDSDIEKWAMDHSKGQKILFIDEVNVTARQWNEFEGLFSEPPGMLIKGKFYPLTENHKVVFAGNPMSYGGERKLAPFFKRHGNALVFEPMSQEYIFANILKPVFENTPWRAQSLVISAHLLNLYKFLCESSTDEVLISPREVQMMALMALSHLEQFPKENPIYVAKFYGSMIASSLVPPALLSEFNKKFKMNARDSLSHAKSADIQKNSAYLNTPSRQPTNDLLNNLLSLSEFRQSNPQLNEAQKFGGLGGIVIEGEPGIGKSEMAESVMVARGYKKASLDDTHVPEKSYYIMPVSMPTEEKKKLLLKAFNEGAKVIIDEINSSPMMERLLNDLLMGKSPDGKRPERPGFMIIGTQNPATMSGRRAMSKALARRMVTCVLPSYTSPEMVKILIHRGVEEERASRLVDIYLKNVDYANDKQLSPIPTFRDLIRVARHYERSEKPEHMKAVETEVTSSSELKETYPGLGLYGGKTSGASSSPSPSPPIKPEDDQGKYKH